MLAIKSLKINALNVIFFFIIKPNPCSSAIWEFCKHAILEKQNLIDFHDFCAVYGYNRWNSLGKREGVYYQV